ncbi:hypothetical protein BDZ94DRAFT_1336953 [Collybia nuda]|uniref:Uncharacterized protein n=1 Tax=Collybia nuda TaxID=64659 RepID=A0A9P5YCP7_9AGAR|nr:hypothetical protein BDZ94DRAFT_1336953 [Collybia nuda]
MPSSSRISPALAEVQQSSHSHAPILTNGCLTPQIIEEFKTSCLRYFKHKKIEDNDKVSMIIYNLLSPSMVSWVKVKSAHLCTLSWAEFMAKFKHKWLPRGWEHKITNKVIAFQRPTESFWEWQNEVCANNNLIFGLHEHVNEDHLRQHLYSQLHDELQLLYIAHDKKGELTDIEDIDEWIDEVCQLNEGLVREKRHLNCMWMEAVSGKSFSPGLALINKTNTISYGRTAQSTSTTKSTTFTYVSKLTDDEHRIILAHKGCNKCWKLYVEDHFSCNSPILLKSEYILLTDEIAKAAKHTYMKASKKPNLKPAYVAAIFAELSDKDEAVEEGDDAVGSDDYNDLDSRKLKKLFPVSNAFTMTGDDGVSSLSHYVKLSVQSPDAQWKALIVTSSLVY